MSTPISSVSGLASGLQWQDLIDQIMAVEQARRLDPLMEKEAAQSKSIDAWNSYQSVVARFAAAADALADGSAFDVVKVTGGTSSETGRTLFSATASPAAPAGRYSVEVLALAQAEKLSSAVVSSTTDALGLSGDFLINGRRIEISAADTLATIRDRINAANSGPDATHVTATILSTGSGTNRLILTSDSTGADGIELVDGDQGVLEQLGFLDGTLVSNVAADGSFQSHGFSTATVAIATLLGVTLPPPSVVKIGDKTISVDLSTDSLASIAARINAAGGSARVVEEDVDGTTVARLLVDSQVSAVAGDAGSERTLELLGFLEGGRSAVAQTVTSSSTLTDAATGAVASGSTLLTALRSAGGGSLAVGDTVSIRGSRADGSAVAVDFTVDAASTVDDLLAALDAAYGTGSRPATASFVDGHFVLTDQAGGESQLSLSLTTSGAGALDFGRGTVTTAGRARELVAGSDAQVRVDGVLITQHGNTIADALSGITIQLEHAEAGTVVDLALEHDSDAAVKAVKAYASAYNDLVAFVRESTAEGGPLAHNGSLRSSLSTITSTMLTDVMGLAGSGYDRPALVGVALSKTGTLEVDEATLRSALASNLADVRRLFSTGGTVSSSSLSYVAASSATEPGSYDVEITSPATAPGVTGSVLAGGVYSDDGSPDGLTISDAYGHSGTIQLADGDTVDDIVAKLQQLFASEGFHLEAVNDGGALTITGTRYGSAETFTIAYTGGGSDSSAQLGIAAGSYAGTDVEGTIGGFAATGVGRTLTGADGTDVEGLAVMYTGTTAGSAGQVTYSLGAAGMITRVTDAITRSGDGLVASQVDSLQLSNSNIERRIADIQRQLDIRREALIAQYTAMEVALSRIQSQQAWLTSQLAALPGFSGGSRQS